MLKRVLWQVEDLVLATGGQLEGGTPQPITGVSIDTRTLEPGDLYVAIKGDAHDGHDFVSKALAGGASLAMVSHTDDKMRREGALIKVLDDPLHGLERLGAAARARSHAQIIAVTGSVGKTSTKEMLRSALAASGLTHASAASYNNHWGVPLTLARLPAQAAYGVFEIGMNHVGEIKPLVAMVKPHIAIVTTVAPVHIGNFSGLEEIADAKAEIFTGLVEGGVAIINRDNSYFDRLSAAAHLVGARVVSFGSHPLSDVRLVRMASHPHCSCITADILGEEVIYKLGIPGEHMAMNSLAVLAAVKLAGADLARAMLALSQAEVPKGRGVQHKLHLRGGSFLLIDESYNANPVSMAAALGLLALAPVPKGGRRIAVLGDMLELGQHGEALHQGLANSILQHKTDVVFAAGPLMGALWAALPQAKHGVYANSSAELLEPLLRAVQPGDAVMIKGSLGSRMGILVEALTTKFSAHVSVE